MKSTLRLFNAIQVEKSPHPPSPPLTKGGWGGSADVLARMVKNGYILDPAIEPTSTTLDLIESVIGLSGEKANAAFHKSWAVVRDTPIEVLVIQQILHYLTTYGFEHWGIFHPGNVFIPWEILELPAIREDVPLMVIKAMTGDELLEAALRLASGVALAPETLTNLATIIRGLQIDISDQFIGQIGNRELKAMLYSMVGLTPVEPVEYLRYVIYRLTGETLVIKNDALIEKIKAADAQLLDRLIGQAPPDLASIFYRFKPLFLAMKSLSKNKTFFNHLRKQAVWLHRPMPPDYLNSITAQVKAGELDLTALERKLETTSIFRKIRLAYALRFRFDPGSSIVYQVRNGRGWATDFAFPPEADPQPAFELVLESIAASLRPALSGKIFYIPAGVHYALPATEKQFIGHLPAGSYVSLPEDMVAGIHWQNTDRRIDLDLSMMALNQKIGWDSLYRTDSLDILFSGDMTTAPPPQGAAELFYIRQGVATPYLIMVNYFNFDAEDPVEAKLFVAGEKIKTLDRNYMVDPGNIIAQAGITLGQKQNTLALVAGDRFYFTRVALGNAITARNNKVSQHAQGYLAKKLEQTIDLAEVFSLAGATIIQERPAAAAPGAIDLSPAALDKTTILDLIQTRQGG